MQQCLYFCPLHVVLLWYLYLYKEPYLQVTYIEAPWHMDLLNRKIMHVYTFLIFDVNYIQTVIFVFAKCEEVYKYMVYYH